MAVEVAADERGPLDGDGRQQHVDAHGAVAVALEERHQEAEADEDHHVHVLEHWRERERNVLFNDALNTFYLRLYGRKE